MTRREALAAGEMFYTGGRPCPHCNGRRRYASNAECKACRTRLSREYYHRNKEYRDRRLAEFEDRYWALSGVELAAERLRQRRSKALRRMAERTRPVGGEEVR
jgi:hypothetical protein